MDAEIKAKLEAMIRCAEVDQHTEALMRAMAQAAWDLARKHYTRRDQSFMSNDVHKEELKAAVDLAVKAERERIRELMMLGDTPLAEIRRILNPPAKEPK